MTKNGLDLSADEFPSFFLTFLFFSFYAEEKTFAERRGACRADQASYNDRQSGELLASVGGQADSDGWRAGKEKVGRVDTEIAVDWLC